MNLEHPYIIVLNSKYSYILCRCVPSQALSKSLVAYYQKYVDEQSKQEIKDILVQFDRSVLN